MSIRTIVVVVIVVMAFLGGIVWQSQMQKPQPPQQAQGTEQPAPQGGNMPPGGGQVAAPATDSNPGLAWNVPKNWNTGEQRPMRLATYGIPAAAGDGEGAECAVFYFGPAQGGGVQENLDRWVGQFEHPKDPQRSQSSVNGFPVYRVSVKGDYLAPSGPMMQSSGTKKGYALMGAIVEGPAGRVFFKITGPDRTVQSAKHGSRTCCVRCASPDLPPLRRAPGAGNRAGRFVVAARRFPAPAHLDAALMGQARSSCTRLTHRVVS